MDLFINTDAPDPRHALVAALRDAAEVPLPPLSFGDTIPLVIYLVTKAGAYYTDAGSVDLTPALELAPRGDASLIDSPEFTAGQGESSKGFGCNLVLTGTLLALVHGAGVAPLVLRFSTTEDGVKTTWLEVDVELIGTITGQSAA